MALDLGLKSYGMLSNWLREYRKNGYNIVNHKKERPPHAQTKSGNRTVKARNPALTPAELKADYRERICKKIERLSRPADQEPQAPEISYSTKARA